jgi:hypothetical protein
MGEGQKAQPKKPRPRSRDLAAAGDVFGDFTPWRNPPAVYSYVTSLFGLVPIAGLVLGPIAIALGVIGRVRLRRQPDIRGGNFAGAGIILGSIDSVTNAVGIAMITHGFGWW